MHELQVLWTSLLGSWAAQVPAVLICTRFYRNDLYGLFTGVTIGYAAVDVMLLWVVVTTDWPLYAREASRRNETKEFGEIVSDHGAGGAGDVEMLSNAHLTVQVSEARRIDNESDNNEENALTY